jgi:2-polyprenyl-3-methyl-5-hydroxy-6-metoxy-1,4-benzoquinol methylase
MAAALSSEDRDEMAIPSYLHPNPALRWMAWRRVEVVAREMRKLATGHFSPQPPSVLDYGCGTGILFNDAQDFAARIYGVDIVLDCARMLVEHCKLANVDLYTPEEAQRQLGDGSIDLIVAAEVLEHIEPLGPTLEFYQRILSPRGRLLVSLPTEGLVYKLGRRLAGFKGHYHHSNAASIHATIVDAGFRLEKMQKIPLPGPLSVYWVCTYVACGAG